MPTADSFDVPLPPQMEEPEKDTELIDKVLGSLHDYLNDKF